MTAATAACEFLLYPEQYETGSTATKRAGPVIVAGLQAHLYHSVTVSLTHLLTFLSTGHISYQTTVTTKTKEEKSVTTPA